MMLLPPPRGRLDDEEPFQPDIMRRVDGAAAAGRREYAAAATTTPHVFPSPLSAGAGTRRPAGTDALAKPSARPALPPTRHAREPPRGEAAPATCIISQPQAATSASTTRLRANAWASRTADLTAPINQIHEPGSWDPSIDTLWSSTWQRNLVLCKGSCDRGWQQVKTHGGQSMQTILRVPILPLRFELCSGHSTLASIQVGMPFKNCRTFCTFARFLRQKRCLVFATMLLTGFFFIREARASGCDRSGDGDAHCCSKWFCFLFACILRLHLNTHVSARH